MEASRKTVQPLVEINLLGRFRVIIDGVAIDEKRWTRNSAKSLVKLLALKPFHSLHREQIMDLLWLEQAPETALNNLNKAIYGARRAFEPNLEKGSASQFLLTEKNQIILASPGSLRVDLDEFERLANFAIQNSDLESGQKALEIYQGDLLVEDIYEDWIYTRRETMRLLFRKTATKIAGLFVAENNHQASIEILKKLACDDASDEFVQRLLMRLYAETGSKYQALKQFQLCRDALQALGIEPETETIKLEQLIKRSEILPVQNGYGHQPVISAVPIISNPRIRQLTFQKALIRTARFLPAGKTIIFSAALGSSPALYTMPLETGEMQPFGLETSQIFSVSSDGDLAAALNPKQDAYLSRSVLAKISTANNIPLELLPDIHFADWHPTKNARTSLSDEQLLAVVRDGKDKTCLEFPVGNVIFETAGWIGNPRFSPDGKKIAFIEHPLTYDDRGFVVVIDLESREKRLLTENMAVIQGLAWANDEIWFTGEGKGSARMIQAVNLKGETRRIYRTTGVLTLHDIDKSGAALVSDDKIRIQMAVRRANESVERDLSWHDWTIARDVSDDGETLLFEEAGISGGNVLAAYVRNTDGSAVKKIGDSAVITLSHDAQSALLRFHTPHNHLAVVSITDGEIKPLENDPEHPLDYQVFGDFFPDGKRIIFSANEANRGRRVYIQNLGGGKPALFLPDQKVQLLSNQAISPDGKSVILTDSEKRLILCQISDGITAPLKNLEAGFWLIRWMDDGENIFIWRRGDAPAFVYKYNLASGKKQEWLRLMPQDSNGVSKINAVKLTPDGKTYAYSYVRESSELFLMEDLG